MDNLGRPVSLFKNNLIFGVRNTHDRFLEKLDLALFFLGAFIVAAAYPLSRVPLVLFGVTIVYFIMIVVRITLRIHGSLDPLPNQIVAQNVKRIDFFLKSVGYQVLFGPIGTLKGLASCLIMGVFMLGFSFISFGSTEFIKQLFFWIVTTFGISLVIVTIMSALVKFVGILIYQNNQSLLKSLVR